jgi:hypothetical protein
LLGNVPDAVDYIFESTDEGHKQLSALGVEREESNVSRTSSLPGRAFSIRGRGGSVSPSTDVHGRGRPFVVTFLFGKVKTGPARVIRPKGEIIEKAG